MIIEAIALAKKAHSGQSRRFTGEPYIIHPARVAMEVSLLSYADNEMIAAAWLHDVLEDTQTPEVVIACAAGQNVLSLVKELTFDDSNLTSLNYDQKKQVQNAHTAQAQADLNKRVVEAERDKQVAVLAAEAQKERTRLDAEAEKIKLVTTAEGTKEARTLEAAGILAVGQAEAEAQKLRLTAYNAPGSELFVKVEIAKYLSQGMGGIKGFLPEGINVTTLGQNFNSAIENILGAAAAKTLNAPESVPTSK